MYLIKHRIQAAALLLILALSAACAEPPGEAPQAADSAPDLIIAPDAAPDLPPPIKPLGATCQADSQCAGDACLPDPLWPSGYCTIDGCGAACEAAGGACTPLVSGERVCAKRCATSQDCRFGYACHRDRQTLDTACIPAALVPPPPVVDPPPPTGATDGAACSRNAECAGGRCLQGEDWPGGFCTTSPCGNTVSCATTPESPPAACLYIPSLERSACVTSCKTSADCRRGYACERFDDTRRICTREPRPINDLLLPPSSHPVGITCQDTSGGRFEIGYTIAPEAPAHAVVMYSSLGRPIKVETIVSPVRTIDAQRSYKFHLEVDELPPLSTLIFPGPPSYASLHRRGDYTINGTSEDPQVCWYVVPHAGAGRWIDVNVYLVGRADITRLEDMPGLSQMFDHMNLLLSTYNIALRPRLRLLADAVHVEYSWPRSLDDLFLLGASTRASLVGAASLLSVNLILVAGFADPDLLGYSPGLPGPPGLHGLVTTAVFASHLELGADAEDNKQVANTVLHEIFHNLGLRHTSEAYGYAYDPLPDTPACSASSYRSDTCPDRLNLMFPYSSTETMLTITPNQIAQARSNPLVVP